MATAAQIEANQANAQLSTGPRTQEGKFAAALNSTKHGFFAKHAVILTEQEHRTFESLRNSYVYQFNPANVVEVTLLDQLVLASWNMERANRLEAELATAEGLDPLLSEKSAKTLDRIIAFRMRAERTFHKCHKELRDLAAKRPRPVQNKPLVIVRNEPKFVPSGPKVGRNEPCPCKSGRKFKQCCLHNPTRREAQSKKELVSDTNSLALRHPETNNTTDQRIPFSPNIIS